MSNMELWNRVCVTDPSAVKPITGKQYKGNSPKPYWLIQRATEELGPCGIGWGVNVLNERFERLTENDVLHVAMVEVWYLLDGKRGSIQQMGQTKAAYMSKNGLMVDEDAPKKSVTDGMVKCLSMLGFAGDIFSGQWDDSKYVEWANEQYHPKPKLKIAALDGIGDALSEDTKQVIQEWAAEATEICRNQSAQDCIAFLREKGLEDDERLYMDSKLPSDVRSAMRKVNQPKKEAA